ncbi:MAG: translocation/assembly module TamB domain-containing protein [Sandaracinaceae bacterium]|nr:translocation/assembly module TamB domain-containing protein [Sandaracinaceae bacterium]
MTRALRWQRWRRWALVLGVFALGIPASAAGLVRSRTSRDRLQTLAHRAIRDELGLDATIGRIQLQLVPFSLVARDITLDDPVYGRTAEADELRITPSFRALLRGGLDIQTITIRGANLRLVIRNGQVRNLPRGGPDQGGGQPELPFDALHVYESTLTVDADPDASGQLRDVELHLRSTDDGFSVDADSRAGWIRHAAGRETIQRVTGEIEVTEDQVRIPHLRVRTPDLRVSVDAGQLPLPLGETGYTGRVHVSYDLAHLARAPFPPEVTLPPIRGRLTVDAQLSMEGEDQVARGAIDLQGGAIEQFGIGESTHLEVRANNREIQILEGSIANLPHDGGRVLVQGTITLDPERGFPVDVTARPEELSMTRLMVDLGVTENGIVEWFFNGEMRLAGTLDPVRMSGPIRLATHDFQVSHDPWHAPRVRRVISVPRADFTGRWSIREDAIRFENLVGTAPHTTLRGNVLLGFHNELHVDAVTESLDLRDITPLDRWPIQGTGRARCLIDNTFQDPHVTGHVVLAGFQFDDFRLGDVESDALLDPDGLGVRFAMVHATKEQSRYRVEDLYLDFHRNRFEMTGLLHLDELRMADFYHVFQLEEDERYEPYQGTVQGQASLHYTNGFPEDLPSGTLELDMNLDFPAVSLNDYAFTDGHLVGRWRWLDWDRGAAGGELSVAYLSLRKGAGTVTVDGRMSLGGHLDLNVVADRLALAEIEGVGDRLPGVSGVGTVVGHVGGTFDVMRANFDVGVTNVNYDGRPLGDGRFYVRLTDTEDPWVAEARTWDRDHPPRESCALARDGLANADWPADPPMRTVDGPQPRLTRPMAFTVCGTGLDDHLVVDLAVGRTNDLPLRGALRLDGLDLRPLLPTTPDGQALDGSVTGVLAFIDGGMRRPETLEGSVRLSEVRVAQGDLEIHGDREVRLGFKDGILAVERARFLGPDSRIRLRGYASIEDGLALRVNGNVDLGIVARLTRSVSEAGGSVRGSFSVTGDVADPELFGQADVRNGRFRFASFEPAVENLGGTIRFSERSILFEGFGADVAGGHVDLVSGAAELRDQGLETYSFDLRAAGLSYDFDDDIETSFGGRTELTWNRGDRLPTLRGELRVDRFEYARPIELRSLGDVAASFVRGAFRTERTTIRRYDPDQDTVALDLHVVQRAPFRIANNLINADVRIRTQDTPFRIVGTDQRFGVLGAMEIRRGQVFFQNNQFDVRSGTIDFTDEQAIEPHLNVIAVTEVRRTSDLSAPSFRITLTLRGTPPSDLTLTTRAEPELSQEDVLTLLAIGMTRAELNQLQQGSGLATSAALDAITRVTGVDREVRRTIGIDEFGVVNGYSPRTGRSEPRLSVGTRIAERVRLSATTGIGETREFRGAVDLTVDENQRVGVSYDNYNYDGTSSFGNLGVDWVYHLEFE